MPSPAPTLENSIRFMRTFFFAILVAAAMQISLAEKLSHEEPRDVHAMWLAFLVTAAMVAAVAVLFRLRMLRGAEEVLSRSPNDPSSLGRWKAGQILSIVLSESIVLFGVSLRFTGGTTMQALPFYAAGIGLMILWFPRRP